MHAIFFFFQQWIHIIVFLDWRLLKSGKKKQHMKKNCRVKQKQSDYLDIHLRRKCSLSFRGDFFCFHFEEFLCHDKCKCFRFFCSYCRSRCQTYIYIHTISENVCQMKVHLLHNCTWISMKFNYKSSFS